MRKDFTQHECLKDLYAGKIQNRSVEIMEMLAEYLMMLRRSKEGLGLCMYTECINKFRGSQQMKNGQGMVTPNTTNQPTKCARCKTVIAGYEDSFFCIYCQESYCPFCLGYAKYFDMEELLAIVKE